MVKKCRLCGNRFRTTTDARLYCDIHKITNLSGRDLIREHVRQRDNHACQKCGKPWHKGQRRFDVHHLDGCGIKTRLYDRRADMEGLITLCHGCHLTLESVRRKMAAAFKARPLDPIIEKNYKKTRQLLIKFKSVAKVAKKLKLTKQAIYLRLQAGEMRGWDEE